MKIKFRETHEIHGEITCPYCKYNWEDSQETLPDETEGQTLVCPDCEKKFAADMCITIDYRTSKDCELNGELHEYKQATFNDNFNVCIKCGTNESKEPK